MPTYALVVEAVPPLTGARPNFSVITVPDDMTLFQAMGEMWDRYKYQTVLSVRIERVRHL